MKTRERLGDRRSFLAPLVSLPCFCILPNRQGSQATRERPRPMNAPIGSYNPTHFERIDAIIRNINRELEDSEWDQTYEIGGERLIYLNGRLNRLKARMEDGETLEPRF